MTYFDERTGARDAAARLHGMLREVRGAPKDARDFLVFDKRDDWKDFGVGDDHIAAFDLTDDDALDGHIAQASALARALGEVDEDDTISGGSGNDLLYGGAGDDALLTPTRSAAQHGLRGSQPLPPAPRGYQAPGGLGAAAVAPRSPHERFLDELREGRRKSLVSSVVGNVYRKTLSPADHAAEVRRMSGEADAYEAAMKTDPPTTLGDMRGEIAGKALSFVADPLAVGSTVIGGAGLLGAKLAARLAARPLLSAAGAIGLGAGMVGLQGWKQRQLDDWNERD